MIQILSCYILQACRDYNSRQPKNNSLRPNQGAHRAPSHLGGSGGMPPRKDLKSWCSEMTFPAFWAMFDYFSKLHNYSLFRWRKSIINVFEIVEIVILSDTVNLSHYQGLIQRPVHPSFGWVGRTYDGLLIWMTGIPSTVKKNIYIYILFF